MFESYCTTISYLSPSILTLCLGVWEPAEFLRFSVTVTPPPAKEMEDRTVFFSLPWWIGNHMMLVTLLHSGLKNFLNFDSIWFYVSFKSLKIVHLKVTSK